MDLTQIETVIFDLDGVVYVGETPLPGAAETLGWLHQTGRRTLFYSNNSTRSRWDYREKLRRMGISVELDELMNSAYATALYLLEQGRQSASVFAISEGGIQKELLAIGARIVERVEDETQVDFVVVGLDRTFTYEKLQMAYDAIQRGATFIATNRDTTVPVEGCRIPGGGAIVAAIEAACGKPPILIGKPNPYALLKLMEQAGAKPQTTLFVGDRLDTDVQVGRRAGTRTALVLTGVTTETEAQAAPSERQPDVIVKTLPDLKPLLRDGQGT